MSAVPDLTTARLALRPFANADLDAVHALWTDADMRRYLCDDTVVSIAQSREWLEGSTAGFVRRRFGLWGVHEGAAGGLIGFCGCRAWPTGEPELMYGLLRPWWRQGLATEAATAVLTYVFEVLGHPVVMAATDPPNVASIRVMERLGMTFDWRGEMHGLDTVVYRLSRERWRRRVATAGAQIVEYRRRRRRRRGSPDDRHMEPDMAKARRTTHRSTAGKKLYAVRSADGTFKDIQTFERAHRDDIAHTSKAETAARAARKRAAGKTAKKTVKKVARKSAKKTVKKVARKSAKKTAKKP